MKNVDVLHALHVRAAAVWQRKELLSTKDRQRQEVNHVCQIDDQRYIFCFNPFEAVHPLGAGSCARQCLRRLPAPETESPTKSANSHKCFNFQQGKTVPYSFFY